MPTDPKMTSNVITLTEGRRKLQERDEAKRRMMRRRIRLGLSSASVEDLNGLPESIDDIGVDK